MPLVASHSNAALQCHVLRIHLSVASPRTQSDLVQLYRCLCDSDIASRSPYDVQQCRRLLQRSSSDKVHHGYSTADDTAKSRPVLEGHTAAPQAEGSSSGSFSQMQSVYPLVAFFTLFMVLIVLVFRICRKGKFAHADRSDDSDGSSGNTIGITTSSPHQRVTNCTPQLPMSDPPPSYVSLFLEEPPSYEAALAMTTACRLQSPQSSADKQTNRTSPSKKAESKPADQHELDTHQAIESAIDVSSGAASVETIASDVGGETVVRAAAASEEATAGSATPSVMDVVLSVTLV